MRIKASSMPFDVQTLLQAAEAPAALAELKEGLAAPLITSARWLLLSHRPLPGAAERYVMTYAVNLAVDGLGIMPEEYLGHDGDVTPEFDLRSLLTQVQQRANRVQWKARVELTLQLKAGMLFDLNLRFPDELPGEWAVVVDEPPAGQSVQSVEDLRKAAKLRRKLTITGTFDSPEQIPEEVRGRLGVITAALVDTPYEIETGWPVGLNMTRYEWEE